MDRKNASDQIADALSSAEGKLAGVVGLRDLAEPNLPLAPLGERGQGVRGCERTGPRPRDNSQFLATDSRTPYTANFDGSEANQTAHFIGRWMSTRNEPGPLSETVSATVPG